MKSDIEEREPVRDPALAAALREAYADEPLGPERAAALRRAIRQRAETVVAAQSDHPVAQPEPARRMLSPRSRRWTGLLRPAWSVPVLLAATLATVLLVSRDRHPPTAPQPPAPPAAGVASAEQALSADVSDAEFARLVTQEDDPAALLAIAVGDAAPARPR